VLFSTWCICCPHGRPGAFTAYTVGLVRLVPARKATCAPPNLHFG
jgi:hypothetical protein